MTESRGVEFSNISFAKKAGYKFCSLSKHYAILSSTAAAMSHLPSVMLGWVGSTPSLFLGLWWLLANYVVSNQSLSTRNCSLYISSKSEQSASAKPWRRSSATTPSTWTLYRARSAAAYRMPCCNRVGLSPYNKACPDLLRSVQLHFLNGHLMLSARRSP